MTGKEIRQSFLDFFREREHTIVPSASLLPDSPNLLFTNAGMNQFVPIFLGERKPDVSRWPGVIPGRDTRAADTQKCIRAGGKHNDLEDVGFDTYHHTFFEMLGNWSFGDYFKKEAIEWAWELLTERWGFPKHRLYATVYKPDPGEPGELDEEALEIWRKIFRDAGLDPEVHVRFGNQKENFWMMGDTGPCGPCSEIHIDLTPKGDSQGRLVNAGSPWCIEIWNLVFIQLNANPDGTYSPLPARHVDTGMGFERAAAVIQCTRGFQDFSRLVSNYETDIFQPLFRRISELSGRTYAGTLPDRGEDGAPILRTEQQWIDIAFRVIADHIRAVAFAIADGILPGNTDRHYVIRRILRRAVRYGRTLGFHDLFFYKLVAVLAETMGDVFPEIREKQRHVEEVIQSEEAAFNRTLDRGIEIFNEEVQRILSQSTASKVLPGEVAFRLYDTYGFPLDLTQLMARERGLTVDLEGFQKLMEEQRERARRAQKKETIEIQRADTLPPTRFVGYDTLSVQTRVLAVLQARGKPAIVLEQTPFYAEAGGQIGDRGTLQAEGQTWQVIDTQKVGETWLHILDADPNGPLPEVGMEVTATVDRDRRLATQRHHTATHLLHWALGQVLGPDVMQKGSYVGPDKLTFDFNARPLSAEQIAAIERLVNERIVENHPISWTEVKYDHIRDRKDIRQIFGEKYGEWVRVLQIGGDPHGLNGFSMELCGGTHCRATGELGLFRIVSESAVAAGIRRIEAQAGLVAYESTRNELALIDRISKRVGSPPHELERKIENLIQTQKSLEKQLRSLIQKQAVQEARALVDRKKQCGSFQALIERVDYDADTLQAMANALRDIFPGPIFLAGVSNGAVSLVATVPKDLTAKVHAGKWMQAVAPVVGGRGGGRPDNARGGGRQIDRIDQALQQAAQYLAQLG